MFSVISRMDFRLPVSPGFYLCTVFSPSTDPPSSFRVCFLSMWGVLSSIGICFFTESPNHLIFIQSFIFYFFFSFVFKLQILKHLGVLKNLFLISPSGCLAWKRQRLLWLGQGSSSILNWVPTCSWIPNLYVQASLLSLLFCQLWPLSLKVYVYISSYHHLI